MVIDIVMIKFSICGCLGRGRVSYLQEDYKHGTQSIDVKHGDVYRLEQGSVFYVESNPSPTREKLRIHAVFNAMNIENTAV